MSLATTGNTLLIQGCAKTSLHHIAYTDAHSNAFQSCFTASMTLNTKGRDPSRPRLEDFLHAFLTVVVAVLADVGLCPLIPSCPALLSPGKNVTRYYCTNQTTVCPVCVGSARCVFQYVSIGSGSRPTWLLEDSTTCLWRETVQCVGSCRIRASLGMFQEDAELVLPRLSLPGG